MKIICKQNDLSNSISIALKAVGTRTNMSILECILIDCTSGTIKMTTNNKELCIETQVTGAIVEEGMVAVNAKVFSEIIRKLPDSDVTVCVDNNYSIQIVCEKAKFKISGQSGEDFPSLPSVEKGEGIEISQFNLKEIIRQTVFSIADNDTKAVMSGELFTITGDLLKVISLDGHRISIRKLQLKQSYPDMKVIVPGKTLSEISKILNGDMEDSIFIYVTDNSILFEFDQTIVLSRVISGEFYPVEQMISNDYETKITVAKKDLLSGLDRSTLLLKESDKKPVVFNIQDGRVDLQLATEIGSMDEDIEAEKDGKDMIIGFNPRFLMDVLRVVDDEQIDIYFFNSKAPCFIRNKEETYVYIVLPVNFV